MKKIEYAKVLKDNCVKRPLIKNTLYAFFFGGFIGLLSQILKMMYMNVFNINEEYSNILMALSLVFISAILTGFGVFDYIGEIAGAGTYIPITGFANSVASSALESKSEGLVKGILMNTYKLAGAVIATGIVSSFTIGLVIYLVRILL